MHPRDLSIADFTYALPEARIAQQPLTGRDASKLLVYRDGVISDHVFRALPELLPENALLVLNDTRVVNARIVMHRSTGARIELLCLEPAHGKPVEQAFREQGRSEWQCFIGNAKRWKDGETLTTTIDGVTLNAQRVAAERVLFSWAPGEMDFAQVLDRTGLVPLPPYMKRAATEPDKERYNTVFAKHEGSVAAPTASLHLTDRVLAGLAPRNIATTELTLHVGAGTFLPVSSERMEGHSMHREQVRIPLTALERFVAQLGEAPIVPVGTTALRTLESIYWHGVMILQGRAGEEMDIDQWEPYGHGDDLLPNALTALEAVIALVRSNSEQRLVGSTRLLIAPGYQFRFADALVTNFHQPQSTLLLLVAAFLGKDWRNVYDHALKNDYRFLSYGDGSLLYRKQ
ncbi:MAG: S-adenosylmethionine:tRNA ribosyltransferase-isomerase [Flavobacteriales bacterium]